MWDRVVVYILGNSASWTKISTGGAVNLGLKSDGSLWAWGDNTYGGLGTNDIGSRLSAVQVGTSSWTAISAGTGYAAAIRSDGGLFTWGFGTTGGLGSNATAHRSSPVQIGTSSWTIVSVAGIDTLDGSLSAAIRSDGALFTWGANANGELGLNDRVHRSSPVQIGSSSWTAVAARGGGGGFGGTVAAIDSLGKLYTWGNNNGGGGLGDATSANRSSPVQVGPGLSFTQIANGYFNYYGITNTGALWVAGLNTTGSLGVNSISQVTSFTQVSAGTSFTQVSGGLGYNTPYGAAIDTLGRLYTWGGNNVGQLGDGTTTHRSAPVQIASGSSYSFVSASRANPFAGIQAIKTDGTLWGTGQIGGVSGGFAGGSSPVPAIINTSSLTAVPSAAGAIQSAYSSPVQVGTSSWTQVSAGTSTLAGISNSSLYTWGAGNTGLLGDSTTSHRSSPVQIGVTGLYSSYSLYSGPNNMALDDSGGGASPLYTWGQNTGGVLGDNTTAHRSSPVQISAGTLSTSSPIQIGTSSWVAVTAGSGFSAAIASPSPFSYLYTWGLNTVGQLGLSDLVHRSSPVQISGASWYSISAGLAYMTGISDSSKRLYTWGLNGSGQLGDGTLASRSSPAQVGTSSWSQVSAGVSSTGAVRLDGSLYTWGLNTQGQLGDGTVVSKSSPGIVGTVPLYLQASPIQLGTSSWSFVSAGLSFSTAIRSDGALFAWGDNTSGQLGSNAIAHRSSPVQIGTSSWTLVRALGSTQTGATGATVAALMTDGSLWTWGYGANGQLGSNAVTNRSSPAQIGTSSWTHISASLNGTYVVALSSTTPQALYLWGGNASGQLGQNAITHRSSPVQVGTPSPPHYLSSPVQIGTSSWVTVAAGLGFSAAEFYGGVMTWGLNTNGQLGQGTVTSTSSPVFLGTPAFAGNTVTQLSAGSASAVVIDDSNILWAWGNNINGQLGDSTVVHRSSPVQVATVATYYRSSPIQIGSSSWSAVSAGTSFTIALRSDSTLWAWGINTYGQLGSSIYYLYSRSTPTQIGGSWSNISTGASTVAALNTSNNLYTWGGGTGGTLGSALSAHRSSPVQVGTGKWTAAKVGLADGAAIDITGNLFTWGLGTNGQLGSNSIAHRSSPAQVGTITITYATSSPVQIGALSWKSVSAGNNLSMAINSNNKLYAWGNNLYGQVGLNINTPYYNSPVQVGTDSWLSISAGNGSAASAIHS
jgi:alpha-tubulin suppressor-like RCC1 family protein